MSGIVPLMGPEMFNDILHLVEQAHASGQDNITCSDWSLCRVRSGMNNALYRVELGGKAFACKLFVQDERRRAQREYDALRLITFLGLDIAPPPLGYDESSTIAPTHAPSSIPWIKP